MRQDVGVDGDAASGGPSQSRLHESSQKTDLGIHAKMRASNRCDNAPRNIFSLTGFVLKILKFASHSPTRAIEHFQDNKNRAIHLLSGFH
jgi:hypothetical protein